MNVQAYSCEQHVLVRLLDQDGRPDQWTSRDSTRGWPARETQPSRCSGSAPPYDWRLATDRSLVQNNPPASSSHAHDRYHHSPYSHMRQLANVHKSHAGPRRASYDFRMSAYLLTLKLHKFANQHVREYGSTTIRVKQINTKNTALKNWDHRQQKTSTPVYWTLTFHRTTNFCWQRGHLSRRWSSWLRLYGQKTA